MNPSHQVLIVGGGLVGASLAIALDRIGVDAALVEATPAGEMPPVFDQRNLSFAEATVNGLSALGVLQALRQPGGPIRRIHVSRKGDFGRATLQASDHGREAFGQVVVARDFGQALESRLGGLRRLTRYRPARFLGFEADRDGLRQVRIASAGGEQLLSARLVVAADGSDSDVRSALGIEVDRHDYGQRLFVAQLHGERAPDGTAYERLTDHGPTALLPRGDRSYGLVHGVGTEEAAGVAALDDVAFLARIQSVFGWRAGRFTRIGARSVYPAVRIVARRTTAHRALLVGNAAQSLHPIGAQGFNLGLRDALTLAELLEHGVGPGATPGAAPGMVHGDPGSDALLQAYAARRDEDRKRTLAFSDGLARITANDASWLRPARSLGLLAVDRLPALQSMLAGSAMGYRGDVPALCREHAA